MKTFRLVLLVIAALGAGCSRMKAVPSSSTLDTRNSALSEPERSKGAAFAFMSQGGAETAAAVRAPASAPPPAQPANPGPVMSSLKLIWTANLQIEVADFEKASAEAAKAAASFGGYVSDRQSTEDGNGKNRGTITLRIPSDRFEGAMGMLKALGTVRNEAVNTQDVTKEYADLETRLKVKRETATRLREILVRQAGKVSEVLEVEREIARVVEEIEQSEGQKRYFDNLVALSTVTLTLYEPDSIVRPGALDPIWDAMRESAHTMSESIGALVLLTSAILPWLIALYLLYRVVRWSRRRSVAARVPSASPQQ